MEKKLRVLPVASAVAIFSAIVYIVCSAAFLLFPQASVALFSTWFHGIQIAPVVLAWNTLLIGFLSIVITGWIGGAVFALVYNMCYTHCEKKGWI